ncbi:exodeoxyribonuclease V subunit gamma [Azotobacter chroococcum]|nr:exodeoxyribonuclease V subunit gamma [Azotobacter chroococcum]
MQGDEGLTPGLMVVHGNRLEELRELVVEWMRLHPLAPLENEVVLVQSNGIAQWLKLALAGQDSCGIAAAIQVELPARFLWRSYRTLLGGADIPLESPLDKAPLTWRLMRLLPNLLEGEAFAPLSRFLEGDADLRKRHQLAERLADLFDQYQVYRADWLADWAEGRDQLRTSRNGARPLDEAVRWQPALWRALLEDVGRDAVAASRAGVHLRFVERLRTLEAAPPGLPRRVIVFGISSLPAQTLEALATLARFSQVLLCVHNPCQYHWGDIVPDQDLLRHQYRRQQRKGGLAPGLSAEDLHQHAHPLLAAWGKQGRDYINLLDMHDDPEHYRERFAILGGRIDLFGEGDTTHLLGQLQDELGSAVLTLRGDVTRLEDNRRAVEATLAAFGKLDTFVGNAAVFDYFTRLDRIAPEELETAFQRLFAVNVQGYLLGARCCIDALRETRGSMIFTLSNSAFYAGGGGILYVTAKHALVGMIRQLAYELAPEIRVNGVAPGATNTPMKSLEGLNARSVPLNQIPGFEQGAAQAVPLARIAEPEDHAGHYVLLASRRDSGLTTATIIHSDGGWEIRSAGPRAHARS